MHQDKIELAVKEAESHIIKFRGQPKHAEAIELLDELRKNSRVFKSFLTNVVVSASMDASFGKPPKAFFLSIIKIMALSDLEFKQEWRAHHSYYNYSSVHSMLESCGASGKVLQLASKVDRGVGQIQKQIATIVQTPDSCINQFRMQEKYNTVVRLFDGLKADKSQLKSFMEKVVDKVRLELGTDSEFERLFTPILEALGIVVSPFKDADKIFHHQSLTSILCCIGASVELVELAVDIDRAGSSVQNIFCLPDSEVEMLGYSRYEIKTSRPTDYLALTGNLEVLKWLSGKIEPALYHSVAASRGLDSLNTLIFSKVVLREPFSTALMTLLDGQSSSVDRQYFHSFNITKAAVLSGDMNVIKFVQKTFDPWLEGLLDTFPQAYLCFSGINYHEFAEYITGRVLTQKIEITRFDPGYLFRMHHQRIGLGECLFQFCQQGLTPTECALFESLIGGYGATPEQLMACFDEPEETDIHVLLSNGEILAEQGQGLQELLASQNEQVEQARQVCLAKWRQKCTIETFSKLLVVDSLAVTQHLNQWALEHNCGSGEGREVTDSATETGFVAALQKYLLTEMFECPDFNRSPRILAAKSNDNALKSVANLLIKQENSLSHKYREQGGRLFKLAPAELLSFRDLLIAADPGHAHEALMSLINLQNVDLLSMYYIRNLTNHEEVNVFSLN